MLQIIDRACGGDSSFPNATWTLELSAATGTIISLGVIGHVMSLVVLARPALWSATYTYFGGLSSANLGALLSSIPSAVHLFSFPSMELLIANVFEATSLLIMICMTVDRYMTICWPNTWRNFHSSRYAVAVTGICYVLAGAVSYPAALAACRWRYFSAIARIQPTIILACFNVKIVVRFRKVSDKKKRVRAASDKFRTRQTSPMGGGETHQESLRKSSYYEEQRLVTLLVVLLVVYSVTIFPSSIVILIGDDTPIVRAAVYSLELVNFAITFYIFMLWSKEMRRELVKLCCQRQEKIAETEEDSVCFDDAVRNGAMVLEHSKTLRSVSSSSSKEEDVHPVC